MMRFRTYKCEAQEVADLVISHVESQGKLLSIVKFVDIVLKCYQYTVVLIYKLHFCYL